MTKARYLDGSVATSSEKGPLIGQPLQSLNNTPLDSAKVVDLDPMQQNVTEIWGLKVGVGPEENWISGDLKVAAYSNAQSGWLFDFDLSSNARKLLQDPDAAFELVQPYIGDVLTETGYYFVSNQLGIYGG